MRRRSARPSDDLVIGRRAHRRRKVKPMTLVRIEVLAHLPDLYAYVEHRRKKLGKTRAQVAAAIGFSPVRYARFWRENITIKECMLSDLERVLGVERAYWSEPIPELQVRPAPKLTAIPEALTPRARMQRVKADVEKIVQELAV